MDVKVRADKKTSVNPIVELEIYDALCRLQYVCDAPLKAVGETLVSIGLNSRQVIKALSEHFRRPYCFNQYLMYQGDSSRKSVKKILGPNQQRISLKFPYHEYGKLKDLHYALDVPLTRATALLIEYSLHNAQALGELLAQFIQDKIEQKKLEQLRIAVREINSQYYHDEIPLGVVMNYLYVQVNNLPITMVDLVDQVIERVND